MRTAQLRATASTHYLFFGGLFPSVRSLQFPCDPEGHVDMDEMTERARDDYLFARTVVGRDYDVPVVLEAIGGGALPHLRPSVASNAHSRRPLSSRDG